jgi:hypothetical protein
MLSLPESQFASPGGDTNLIHGFLVIELSFAIQVDRQSDSPLLFTFSEKSCARLHPHPFP